MAKKPKGELGEAAARLGAKGGKAGGPARARMLTAAEKTEIARLGGKARQRQKKVNGK